MKRCLSCENTFSAEGWDCPVCGFSPDCLDGYLHFSPELAHTSPGFKTEFFQTLANLETDYFWFRARNQLLIQVIRRFLPRTSSLLEVGCGTGFVLSGIANAFPHMELAGSEIDSAGLPYAAGRVPHGKFWQMDARNIPFRDEFDLVAACDVLEHIHEDDVALAEMVAAVKPGGGILLTVPQHRFLWSQADEKACHCRRYEAKHFKHQLEQAGLDVLYTTSFVSLLFPLLVWSRRLQKRKRLADDFALPQWLNRVFEQIMTVERGLIRMGVRFPFGGSLLVVACKR